jgi:hypothetical protein
MVFPAWTWGEELLNSAPRDWLSEASLSAADAGAISRPAAASITSCRDGRSDVSPCDLASYTSHAGEAMEFSFLLHPFSSVH